MTGTLLMGTTEHGAMRHLTTDGKTSLCGYQLVRLVTRLDNNDPVPYTDHWHDDAVTFGHHVCSHCHGLADG